MTRYLQQSYNIDSPEIASVFDELSFWSSRFGALLFEHLQLRPDLHILDLGCGAGFPLFELAHAHGLTVSRISVRNQRWRWGSCSKDGHICLNWRLTEMPEWVRDYVIVHELMHLKRMDHSRKFWALVAKAFPEYEAARRWLRRSALLAAEIS